MSTPTTVRRIDRVMSAERMRDFSMNSRYGRLATIGADQYPYCVPLLFVWMDDEVYLHNTSARGHLRANVEHADRVCFEIDDAGEVFDYGRFECDSSIAYSSVIVFGRIRIVTDRAIKQRFCEGLMAKYGNGDVGRPAGFFPRLDQITVYAVTPERMTGKELALPELSERWPAKDNTRTPNAHPPQDKQ
jgi:uncharacterized protein